MDKFDLARKYICETGVSVFLTGKAGTGKTTFLRQIVHETSKRLVVLAPTGVAAINAGGTTIHSFFQLPLCPYLPDVKELVTEYQMADKFRRMRKERKEIIKTLDLIIIDEISMVRADLLDAVDMTLRKYRHNNRPFGGVQLLMIGDAQQLSPVVTEKEKPFVAQVYSSPYFFESKALKRMGYVTLELTHIFRQKDAAFVALLNDVRQSRPSRETLRALNARLDPDFEPDDGNRWIRLTTHNRQADKVNDSKLMELAGEAHIFEAAVTGNFPENSYPAAAFLSLKEGEQVMFVRNDTSGEGRYYNGLVGTIQEIDEDENVWVSCETADGSAELIQAGTETWENIQYTLDADTGDIVQSVEGTFSQIPLRPAWAVTIHKSQGLTFDHVIIDASEAFAFGQVYVALSRCTSLEGIVLSSPITAYGIKRDAAVEDFSASFTPEETLASSLEGYKRDYEVSQMCECFDFGRLAALAGWLRKVFNESLETTYPSQYQDVLKLRDKAVEMETVGSKFAAQIRSIAGDSARIDERTRKGAAYFLPLLEEVRHQISLLNRLEIDAKDVRKKINEICEEFFEVLGVKISAMESIVKEGFSIAGYQKSVVSGVTGAATVSKEKSKKAKVQKPDIAEEESGRDLYKDNRNPQLVKELIEWRKKKYTKLGVSAFVVMHQKTLLAIADAAPQSIAELRAIKGVGDHIVKNYGEEILSITLSRE